MDSNIKIFFIIIILIFSIKEFIEQYNKKLNNYTIPKISVFLPIYNKAKYLYRSIGSIQNQTLKHIEIITVNDFSQDNTLEILTKMSKKDSRIKIINNDKNRGLLYSRAMGILNSKGQYLMNLDPDDELKEPDNLEYLYKIVNKTKVDIVLFGLEKNNSYQFMCTNFDIIQYQPEIFNSRNRLADYLITNKLIKKELLLKVYKKIRKYIYGEKWNYGEDEIWSVLLNKYAKSMICINKIIFIYYINNDSLMMNKLNVLYMTNLLYWIEVFKSLYNNKKYEKYLISRIAYLIDLIEKNKIVITIIKSNKKLKIQYINLFKNIISKYNIYNDISQKILSSLKQF